jgi:hypothetical protein
VTPDYPVYGRIDGPIVIIGFGSIGKGTLPLIERHFEFDAEKLTVIEPDHAAHNYLDTAQDPPPRDRDHAGELPRGPGPNCSPKAGASA